MPRPGGESDKLGNRYEGKWTIGRLLDLAASNCESLTVEPIGREGLGIEFVVIGLDGTQEYHSVKRQRSKGEWSLAALAAVDGKTGRSILTDLFGKLSADRNNTCCFVSSTGANGFRELVERTGRRHTLVSFQDDLKSSQGLCRTFEKYVLPATSNDWSKAYFNLRQMRAVLIDEDSLTAQIEQHIAFLVYRPDSRVFSNSEVRVLLGDFIVDHLGTPIDCDAVWKFLAGYGYAKRDWTTETTVRDLVRSSNRAYVRAVEIELINGARVPRLEAQTIVDEMVRSDGAKTVLVSASAGVGKSCVMTQVLDALETRGVPVLVVRMDRYGDARSAQDIGKQMELPRSPTVTLAGLANGRESVLVVDQLDAVSQVSGRYPHLWEVFDSLYHEAAAYPNMRLIIACREFDLQHDYRLRKLRQPDVAKQISVQLLSLEEVDRALATTGCAAGRLNSRQKELLRTPFYLALFVSGFDDRGTDTEFQGLGDLFDRYWERKCRAVSARLSGTNEWNSVMDRLCEAMSRDFTVYVPEAIVDGWGDTVAAMLTERVLVRDERQIRFFHESFFDYAFARRFLATGHDLKTLMHSGEQHLFRRSQVRQVLVFLRSRARDQYLAQLHELLNDPSIRFHIKRLVIAWLGTLTDPTSDEWNIVEPLLEQPDTRHHVLVAVRNNLAWFDVLNGLGIISRWLESPNAELADRAVWFLMLDEVQKQRSEIAAALLAPHCGQDDAWGHRLRAYFRLGNAHCSRPIQEVFLKSLDSGVFDGTSQNRNESWCDYLRDAMGKAPCFALEALTHWLDQRIAKALAATSDTTLERQDYDPAAIELICKVARREPTAYVDMFLPRLLTILRLTAIPSGDYLQRDETWYSLSNHEPMYVTDALLDGLVEALEKHAKENPDKVEAMTNQLLGTDWYTLTYVLLRAWSANPARFADACVEFLVADCRRLDVGYRSWDGGGQGCAAVSREAIQICVPYATPQKREQLERTILGFKPHGDEGQYEGWIERLLLEAFGESQLSENGRNRLAVLREKFAGEDITLPPRRCSSLASVVGSPIPPEEATRLTDDEWLAAMRKYDYGWDGVYRGSDPELKGSAVELSRQLEPQAQREKQRFAALASQMEDSIRREYFEAILNGICAQHNLSGEQCKADDVDFRALGSDIVLGLVRRLHRLPKRPCGRSICRAFERLAEGPMSEADLQMLSYYALDDPDSGDNRWLHQDTFKKADPSENAHTDGYSSVRGYAARAIESLLFANYSRSPVLVPLIRKMVHDPSLALRTCVVESILPILNHERDTAVDLFLMACRGAEVVFGSGPFERFVWYASRTHYPELRGVLLRALNSASKKSVTAAARQVCLAAFTDLVAEGDAEAILTGKTSLGTAFRSIRSQLKLIRSHGLWEVLKSLLLTIRSTCGRGMRSSEATRAGAAEVYSQNLGDVAVDTVCRSRLCRLFSDESKEVRHTAARCFLNLKDVDFSKYEDIVRAYIDSNAFASGHDYLLRRLEESTWQLPDITIRLAERFIAKCGTAAGDISTAAAGDSPTVSKLVVRLYTQTDDDSIRTKCLDLIDEMECLAFYEIDQQLAEHDR
ncbi:MAG: hypothetical protein WCB27_04280 [Thermoguttaceae bacterium]